MANILGKRIVVVNDSFEHGLPIGAYGYVIGQIRDTDNAYDYVIRVPKVNKEYFVTKSDIELEQTFIERLAEEAEREALIDYALKTNNRDLFEKIVGTNSEASDGAHPHAGNNDFVRKIRLNAYI